MSYHLINNKDSYDKIRKSQKKQTLWIRDTGSEIRDKEKIHLRSDPRSRG
jgi:hypothetical protein